MLRALDLLQAAAASVAEAFRQSLNLAHAEIRGVKHFTPSNFYRRAGIWRDQQGGVSGWRIFQNIRSATSLPVVRKCSPRSQNTNTGGSVYPAVLRWRSADQYLLLWSIT
jgi:hypothetical protein